MPILAVLAFEWWFIRPYDIHIVIHNGMPELELTATLQPFYYDKRGAK